MAVSPAAAVASSTATSVLGFQGLDRCRMPVGCGLALPMRASMSSMGWGHGHLGLSRVVGLRSRGGVACARTGTSAFASASASSQVEQDLGKSDGIDVLEGIEGDASSGMFFFQRAVLTVTAGLGPLLLDAPNAMAAGGEFGILEGRTFALFHPIVMGGLFLYTLYAGYLGWQWRSVRTVQEEINELKKQLPAAPAEGAAAPPSPVASKIEQLAEYRKELVKGGFRDKHFNAGSILLAFGVFEAVGGAVNTWFRTGKLFPGPHLFAGAGITVLWALSASLVPAMQKGNDTARTAHITLNVLNVLLFIWQIPTGWEIVGKVFEFTTWP